MINLISMVRPIWYFCAVLALLGVAALVNKDHIYLARAAVVVAAIIFVVPFNISLSSLRKKRKRAFQAHEMIRESEKRKVSIERSR